MKFQRVLTLIRLLLKERSNQGCHYLHRHVCPNVQGNVVHCNLQAIRTFRHTSLLWDILAAAEKIRSTRSWSVVYAGRSCYANWSKLLPGEQKRQAKHCNVAKYFIWPYRIYPDRPIFCTASSMSSILSLRVNSSRIKTIASVYM